MKRNAAYLLMISLFITFYGCGATSLQAVGKQQCEELPGDYGLYSCSIDMQEQLGDLLKKDELKRCKCSFDKRFTFFVEDIEQLKKVAKENYQYALMSANAYDKGFQVKVPGWTRRQRLVSEHGFSADIYTSDKGNAVVIAFRGTDDKNDWRYGNIDTDPKGQYRDADTVFAKVVNEYADYKVTTVGHSLGGGLALHVSVTHENVSAVVFNPSPRVFVSKDDIRFTNKVILIYETGEILTAVRSMFTTLNKIDHVKYRFNYLGGGAVSEHSMANFAQCMYASTLDPDDLYSEVCKDNTWW